MRHHRAGKKLGRDSAHRKALYANLAGALIEHGRIKTTEAKAKAVKPFAEQMITLGKRGDLHARRLALAELRSQDVVHKLFADVAPRFADRPGGYTRIVKLGPRQGDAAEMVYLELVDYDPASPAPAPDGCGVASRHASARRHLLAVFVAPLPWGIVAVVAGGVLDILESFALTALVAAATCRRPAPKRSSGSTAVVAIPTQVRVVG